MASKQYLTAERGGGDRSGSEDACNKGSVSADSSSDGVNLGVEWAGGQHGGQPSMAVPSNYPKHGRSVGKHGLRCSDGSPTMGPAAVATQAGDAATRAGTCAALPADRLHDDRANPGVGKATLAIPECSAANLRKLVPSEIRCRMRKGHVEHAGTLVRPYRRCDVTSALKLNTPHRNTPYTVQQFADRSGSSRCRSGPCSGRNRSDAPSASCSPCRPLH